MSYERNEFFSSKYLKAVDLKGQPIVLKIQALQAEMLKDFRSGLPKKKPVLHFVGSNKMLTLNATNCDSVCDLYGSDTDEWNGQPIEIYPDVAEVDGNMKDCLRIRKPTREAEPDKSMDDEIPF
jgi:hypothetical protein